MSHTLTHEYLCIS